MLVVHLLKFNRQIRPRKTWPNFLLYKLYSWAKRMTRKKVLGNFYNKVPCRLFVTLAAWKRMANKARYLFSKLLRLIYCCLSYTIFTWFYYRTGVGFVWRMHLIFPLRKSRLWTVGDVWGRIYSFPLVIINDWPVEVWADRRLSPAAVGTAVDGLKGLTSGPCCLLLSPSSRTALTALERLWAEPIDDAVHTTVNCCPLPKCCKVNLLMYNPTVVEASGVAIETDSLSMVVCGVRHRVG